MAAQNDSTPAASTQAAPAVLVATPAMAITMKNLILECVQAKRPDAIMCNPNTSTTMLEMSSFNPSDLDDAYPSSNCYGAPSLNDALTHGIQAHCRDRFFLAQMGKMRIPGMEQLVNNLLSADLVKLGLDPRSNTSVSSKAHALIDHQIKQSREALNLPGKAMYAPTTNNEFVVQVFRLPNGDPEYGCLGSQFRIKLSNSCWYFFEQCRLATMGSVIPPRGVELPRSLHGNSGEVFHDSSFTSENTCTSTAPATSSQGPFGYRFKHDAGGQYAGIGEGGVEPCGYRLVHGDWLVRFYSSDMDRSTKKIGMSDFDFKVGGVEEYQKLLAKVKLLKMDGFLDNYCMDVIHELDKKAHEFCENARADKKKMEAEEFENYDPEDWGGNECAAGSDEPFFDSNELYMDWYRRDRAREYRRARGDRKVS